MAQSTVGIKLIYIKDNSPAWDYLGVGANLDDLVDVGGWVEIPGITEIPEIGATPDTLETTDFANDKYKTYIPGLLDSGGTLAFKVNDSDEFRDAIDALEILLAAGKIWFGIEIPAPVAQTLTFSAGIAPLGFGGAGANAVLQTTLNVIPDCEPLWFDNHS